MFFTFISAVSVTAPLLAQEAALEKPAGPTQTAKIVWAPTSEAQEKAIVEEEWLDENFLEDEKFLEIAVTQGVAASQWMEADSPFSSTAQFWTLEAQREVDNLQDSELDDFLEIATQPDQLNSNTNSSMATSGEKVSDNADEAGSENGTQPVFATIGKPAGRNIEDELNPYRMRRALRERDFSIGYGEKIRIPRFDGRTEVDMFQLLPRWGRFRNAKQEFLWEVPVTVFTEPETAFAAGLTLMFRQHLTSNRRFSPFVEVGCGFVITNLYSKIDELSGSFQFSPQAGIGARAALSETSDFVVSARFYHLSNAGLRAPNVGLNDYLITVGYSRIY